MIIQADFSKKPKIVATYQIDTENNVSFKVVLKENSDGIREFEIILSNNASESYDEVFSHSFYNDFVLPWVYRERELPQQHKTDNVVTLKSKV